VTEDAFEQAARKDQRIAHARTGFWVHFGIYLAVNLMLFVIWAVTPHRGEVLPWFLWPVMGWGIGIVAHYLGMRGWIRSGARQSYDH
jgi:2TM domain